MNHDYDDLLLSFYHQLHLPQKLARFNPAPADEMKTYQNMVGASAGNMLQSNFLLLSRVFIKNAKAFALADNFSRHKEIKILDIGCKNAPNLMGVFAYFSADKVNYTGVDKSAADIDDAKKAYQKFNHQVEFVAADALHILQDKHYEEKFDLVLIQHPNIEDPDACKIFKEIIIRAARVLANEGVIYITFYYQKEVEFFQKNILPQMPLAGQLKKNLLPADGVLLNRHTQQTYFPENYSFMSVKKPGVKIHLDNEMAKTKVS